MQKQQIFRLKNYDDYLEALKSRVEFFHSNGCIVSDHALDNIVYEEATLEEVTSIFAQRLSGGEVSPEDEKKFRTYTLLFLGKLYAEKGLDHAIPY